MNEAKVLINNCYHLGNCWVIKISIKSEVKIKSIKTLLKNIDDGAKYWYYYCIKRDEHYI